MTKPYHKRMISWLATSLSSRPLDKLFEWRHRRRWLNVKDQGMLHETYFADYKSRHTIAEAVGEVIDANDLAIARIIEFGCSGGNNLRLIRECIDKPVLYCGLDIAKNAIAFASEHFSDDTFRLIQGDEFEELRQTLEPADIFLVSSVLSYLPEEKVEAVFELARHLAPNLVVCDVTERFTMQTGSNDGLFLHPYERLCREAGFEVVRPPNSNPDDRFAVFVARTLQPST